MRNTTHGRLRIDSAGHEIYYRTYGSGDIPLIALHGGPGLDHVSLQRLGELGDADISVILYDQLDSGQSDRPLDESLWTVARFVDELEAVRVGLGFDTMHLIGHSWGGMLGLEYALQHGERLRTLILSNTAASVPEIIHGMTRLKLDLGPVAAARLITSEVVGNFDDPEYQQLLVSLRARYLRRATPFDLERSIAEYKEQVMPVLTYSPVFAHMWGRDGFVCTGTLREWDVTSDLKRIAAPTLIICGLHDEVTVDCHRTLADNIPNNEFVILGNSSHFPMLEKEGDCYLGVVRDFIRRAERATATA